MDADVCIKINHSYVTEEDEDVKPDVEDDIDEPEFRLEDYSLSEDQINNLTKEEEFLTCSFCRVKFASKTFLQDHFTNIHTKKLYRCRLCDLNFEIITTLFEHFSHEHNINAPNYEETHICKLCPRNRAMIKYAVSHMTNHHTVGVSRCKNCSGLFESKDKASFHYSSFCKSEICFVCGISFPTQEKRLQHTGYFHRIFKNMNFTQEDKLIIAKEKEFQKKSRQKFLAGNTESVDQVSEELNESSCTKTSVESSDLNQTSSTKNSDESYGLSYKLNGVSSMIDPLELTTSTDNISEEHEENANFKADEPIGKIKYQCQICGKIALARGILGHLRRDHKFEDPSLENEQIERFSLVKIDGQNRSSKGRFGQKMAKKVELKSKAKYQPAKNLKFHRKTMQQNEIYECAKCDSRFLTKVNFSLHANYYHRFDDYSQNHSNMNLNMASNNQGFSNKVLNSNRPSVIFDPKPYYDLCQPLNTTKNNPNILKNPYYNPQKSNNNNGVKGYITKDLKIVTSLQEIQKSHANNEAEIGRFLTNGGNLVHNGVLWTYTKKTDSKLNF